MNNDGPAKYIASITTRRHPLAFAAYLVSAILGGLLLFGLADTQALNGVAAYTEWLWKVMLFTGGVGGLLSLSVRPRVSPHWPDLVDLLHIESVAAFVCGVGFSVYVLSLPLIPDVDWTIVRSPGVLSLLVLSGGMLYRAQQALREANSARRFATTFEEARGLLDQIEESAQDVLGQHAEDHDHERNQP